MQKTLSYHTEKKSQSDKGYSSHNDRTHVTDKAREHIDLDLSCNNIVIVQKDEEKLFEEYFSATLQAHNEKCLKNYHPDRVLDMQEYKDKYLDPYSKRTCVLETIIQIGNKDDTATATLSNEEKDTIIKTLKAYVEDFKERNIEQCEVTQAIIHFDETTPHMHMRTLYCAYDKKSGLMQPSRKKALIELGYGGNDTRYDNPTTRFTKAERARFEEIAKEHGIERIAPVEPSRTHSKMSVYQIEKETAQAREELEYYEPLAKQAKQDYELYAPLAEKGRKDFVTYDNAINEIAHQYGYVSKKNIGYMTEKKHPEVLRIREDWER